MHETKVGEPEGDHCSFLIDTPLPTSDLLRAHEQLAQDSGRDLVTSPSLLRCKGHLISPSLSLVGFLWLEQAPAGATVPPRSRRVCPKVRCTTLSWKPCKVERRIWVSASSTLPASFLAIRMSLQSHPSCPFPVHRHQWLSFPHWTTAGFQGPCILPDLLATSPHSCACSALCCSCCSSHFLLPIPMLSYAAQTLSFFVHLASGCSP